MTEWHLTYTILHLYHHISQIRALNIHQFSIYTTTFITQWPFRTRFSVYTIIFITQWSLTKAIPHLLDHIYNTMTLNVHRFSIYTITFITQWPLTYTILHFYDHIYHTILLNVHWFSIYTITFITQSALTYSDPPFIPSHL